MRAILAQALAEASNAAGDHAVKLGKLAHNVTPEDRRMFDRLTERMMALAYELTDWCERAEGYPDPPWPFGNNAKVTPDANKE